MTTDAATHTSTTTPSRRVLDPIDRITEVLFGLIMVLTFTGSISVTSAGREEIRTLLIAAAGCNLAWGIVDAVMFLMTQLSERSRTLVAFRAARSSADPAAARAAVKEALPPVVAAVLSADELDAIRARLARQPEPPVAARLTREDWTGALGVLLLVFLSTFPVVLPFLLVDDARLALRLSNAVAIVLLFGAGWAIGRLGGGRPLRSGLWMVLIGVALVAITIVLGG
jgi:VIT1/CCC1 family predicted Fe2+/Mn2+ transporter